MKSLHLRITGKVQGVGFRYWTAAEARRLGIDGWVRNCRDGSVEAHLSGPTTAVAAMLQACHQGPAAARVDNIESKPASAPAEPGFVQLPSI